MTVVVGCSCAKADSSDQHSDQQQAVYRWSCFIVHGNSVVYVDEDSETFFVDAIREFHIRENILVCSEHEYRQEFRVMYANPKIIRIYSKKENVRILEVWV
jgi:hypothetical protein